MTKENFDALSKSDDILVFTAEYDTFLESIEQLSGDAGHSDDKRLDIPVAQQSELFNKLYPDDLGVSQFAQISLPDLITMLGV